MQSEIPTSKTDLLFFLTNKRLSVGAIYVRFLIYVKAIYEQKWKRCIFQLLPRNKDFGRLFCFARLKLQNHISEYYQLCHNHVTHSLIKKHFLHGFKYKYSRMFIREENHMLFFLFFFIVGHCTAMGYFQSWID